MRRIWNSSLVAGFQRIDQTEEDTLFKLYDIAYYLLHCIKKPFIELKHLIELEKIHGVSYSSQKYMNETVCQNIIQNISFCLFDRDTASKIQRVNLSLYYVMAQ